MKRWIIPVLLSIVTVCPSLSIAEDTTFDPGRGTRFTVPLLEIPFGSNRDSETTAKNESGSKLAGKDSETKRKEREKSALDKKVDDAIKRAWGNDATEPQGPQE